MRCSDEIMWQMIFLIFICSVGKVTWLHLSFVVDLTLTRKRFCPLILQKENLQRSLLILLCCWFNSCQSHWLFKGSNSRCDIMRSYWILNEMLTFGNPKVGRCSKFYNNNVIVKVKDCLNCSNSESDRSYSKKSVLGEYNSTYE